MPSISFFPYASIMAVSISRLALGWCCAVFLSRHMSSMPVTITLLILSASSWAFSAGMSKDASSAAKDRGNHPAHVVRAPGFAMSIKYPRTCLSRFSYWSHALVSVDVG